MDDLTGRKLMVVAHPDDETLWGGGLILRYPGHWTVIACSTPMADPVRAAKFLEATRRLGATGIVSPFMETFSSILPFDYDLSGYDVIVTHGAAGEYGHPHHVQVHREVTSRARCRVLTFGGDDALLLTAAERAGKLHALKAYDHILPYDGMPMAKWEALLARYGASWLEREPYGLG
jgi:LmbE family N-acetylglucosaminyl deacetylase